MNRNGITDQQRKILNAACGDLSESFAWGGFRLSKDDWRHLLCGTIKGWRTVPALDNGEGVPGVVMLGASSMTMTKDEATDAITLAFSIGDDPSSQGIAAEPIRWCAAVVKARYLIPE
jgi:hypothetical protein